MPSTTNEQAFEALIERALIGSTREERKAAGQTDVDAQQPSDGQYYWGVPKDMKKKYAIDERRLMSFLMATQAEELAKHKGGDTAEYVMKYIAKEIEVYGIVKVLKEGVSIDNMKLQLFYARPSASDSTLSHLKYQQNQFSLTRQQTFSILHPGEEIDMVLFVNGLPLFTFELKNPWTGQTARKDGKDQLMSDKRSPRDTLLSFGHCLAHFTVDKNEIFFTTHLAGKKTYFMPFNRGLPDGQGAGNPVNPNGGYKTSYLWEWILQRDTVSDIIMNYVLFDYGEAKTRKKVPHIMKNAKKLIFPRFHQLDVVTRLEQDVAREGVGKTYLIEHSAGSGKSNSLTWLAFRLIKTCPQSMEARRAKALTTQLFDSVIVVTDRKLLDDQINFNIRAFGQSQSTIAHADCADSGDRTPHTGLKQHIEDGKRIIITTIQKFPFMCDAISDAGEKNFAIIIDEAHSSQTGIGADSLNKAVQSEEAEGEETDDLIMKLMKDRKMSTNCSYFAFTATPKKETLERFGTQHADGKFYPWHLYSMKQAIEEEFILDVLFNYTTYKSYYEVKKSIEDNPQYDKEKAMKAMRHMVEGDVRTISEKAKKMLQHFDAKIFRSHKLKGQAKGMVVTKDIVCAIRYYQALSQLVQEWRLPYKILIAFTGKKTVDGQEYTEAGMNGFSDAKTAEEFEKDENRLLVVANKYLTGFDQPKLCAMYIDKPLADVLAVQALSRLNRAAPELKKRSEDLFILDFYNSTDDMKKAFDPYYTLTTLSGPTDVNVLHQLRSTLLQLGVFDEDEVNEFAELYFNLAQPDQWAPILDGCVARYDHEIEWPENGKADFKMKCKQFVRIYSRVAAIIDFEVLDWEKLFWFLRFLIPDLHVDVDSGLGDLLDYVDLSTYGLRETALNQTVTLDDGQTSLDPNKPEMVNAGGNGQDTDLDRIIKEFNDKWYRDQELSPDDLKIHFMRVSQRVVDDEDYQNMVVGNVDQQAVSIVMANIISKAVRKMGKADRTFYRNYQNNEAYREGVNNIVTQMIENASFG